MTTLRSSMEIQPRSKIETKSTRHLFGKIFPMREKKSKKNLTLNTISITMNSMPSLTLRMELMTRMTKIYSGVMNPEKSVSPYKY